MIDLSTTYLGLQLAHPLVASASPLSGSLQGIQRLEQCGVSAIVLESLFEEQIDLESQLLHHVMTGGSESYAEALSYFPFRQENTDRAQRYLSMIRQARQSVQVPIIASLNGITPGGWLHYAARFEEAGAHALELNLYNLATHPDLSAAQVEHQYLEVVREVARQVTIPVAVKISPFFTSLPHMAQQFARAGARGLVLFNRFYQPDLDLEQLEVVPHLELSRPQEVLLPITWAAILYSKVPLDLAITGGVHGATEVLKAMMAGARVAMMASRLLREGPEVVPEILQDLQSWMRDHEYSSITQMQGSMCQSHVADPAAYERANYMKTIHSWKPLN